MAALHCEGAKFGLPEISQPGADTGFGMPRSCLNFPESVPAMVRHKIENVLSLLIEADAIALAVEAGPVTISEDLRWSV